MFDPKYPSILISNAGHESDSANHTAYYYFMRHILGHKEDLPLYLYVDEHTGLFKRHPDREVNSFTRDQFTPFLGFCSLFLVKPTSFWDVNDFYQLVLLNNGFFFNEVQSNGDKKPWYDRDWLDFQTRSLYYRMISTDGRKAMRYMHYVGDLNLWLNILYKDRFKPDHNADENIHIHLIVARVKHPTFLAKWAWNYYFYKTKKPWQKKIFDFFDRNGTYYPELVEPAIEAMDLLLKRYK